MSVAETSKSATLPFLQGGGEMGELIRSFDWSQTSLGKPEKWHIALKQTVSMMLTTTFPVLVCWGNDYIQLYNDAFRPINGETKHPQAIGGSARDTYAEIWDTIGPMFAGVMDGNAIGFPDFMVRPDRNGYPEDCYFDFSYSPVRDEHGAVHGVLVICIETTEKVFALKKAKEAEAEMEKAKAETEQQRDRLKRFFMQAPAGICIMDGSDLVFELINPLYQQLFPGRELLGKPVLEAIPEIKGQPIWDILQNVYHTGETFEGSELLIPMARTDDGPVEDRYFNFIYQARRDNNKLIDGILVFAIEVTDSVLAVKELSKTQNNLKMAVTAAQLGTFDMDLEKNTMEWDDRCRTLFGISHRGQVTYEHDFLAGLHPDDRQRVIAVIDNVFIKSVSNGDYDVEYRTIGVEDQKLRWVRAMGKAYFDNDDKPVRFVGSVMDITEQKADDQRKNDFIGMVSHELKTPLTSLSAYTQLLYSKAQKAEDMFSANLLDKANTQVNRMTDLINGFLNISRLESGKMVINKQLFNLEDLIEEMVLETKLTLSSHQIQFEPCNPVTVHADRDKISSVISNLLSNAIKYSPNGKNIIVKCALIANNAQISITDEGMGIKPRDIEKLFERYYRVESDHTQHISGFGIGLYLSAEIINGHGGQIWVESESGVGSTFYFSLPIKT